MSRGGWTWMWGAVVAAGVATGAADSEQPVNGNVFLHLDQGLPAGADAWTELELEFPVRDGRWSDQGWGYATWFQRGHHRPAILKNELSDGVRRLSIDLDVGPDNWMEGGFAHYDVEIRQEGGAFRGSFTGTFWPGGGLLGGSERALPKCLRPSDGTTDADRTAERRKLRDGAGGRATRGAVRGHLGEVWPGVVPGHARVAAGEHPRLPFRKSRIPELKRLAAETPEGKTILARALSVLGAGPEQNDKFSTWPAVGYGFASIMTGRSEYADKARQIVETTIFRNPEGRRGQGITQDIHHGPRLQGLALAFDLCYDAWDPAFRAQCVDEIQRRTWELRLGEFEGRIMAGYNPNPWSNHNAIRVSCAGLGALAILGETNSQGRVMEDAEAVADLMAWEAREHFRTALGGGEYCLEGDYYKVMTLQRGFAYFPPAYETALGRKLDAGGIGDFDMAGYLVEAKPGVLTPGLDDVVWSVGLHTVPADMTPGVKWVFDRAVGLKGSGTFGIGHGMQAPFILANYPYAVAEKQPGDSLRWISPDPRKGHWVFRPSWRDGDDILLTLNMKSESITGSWASARAGPHCDVQLFGFGRRWLGGPFLVKPYFTPGGNPHHGGQITSWQATPDRTCVMNWNLDRAYYRQVDKRTDDLVAKEGALAMVNLRYWGDFLDYGVRATRSMAVDCSGKSGAPLLVAIVDRVDVPRRARTGGGAEPEPGKADGTARAVPATDAEQMLALRALFQKEAGLAVRAGTPQAPSVAPPQVPDATTRWELPLPADGVAPRATVDGNRFTLGYAAGPKLSGLLVGPAKLRPDRVMSDGSGTYFCVFTLHKDTPPRPEVEGEGLSAVVKVGRRTVRFVDGTLVLGDI